jgi:formylglycine-generating enzyme required for sulfatase activity
MTKAARCCAPWLKAARVAVFTALVCNAATAFAAAATESRAQIPGGRFATILPPAPGVKSATVAAFDLDRVPVTNAQFARFVAANPVWRRDRAPRVFADSGYLLHWPNAAAPAAGSEQQPVTHVSWFSANAYCEARGARLPTWHEWEFVSAASRELPDARADPAWRQQILDWYARPAGTGLPEVGRGAANFYGVADLHGLVWEWVLDLGSMMVSSDNREQGDPDLDRFCGSGALSLEEKENYAMLMRIATLSSMQASYTSSSMGFRCATDNPRTP